MRLRRRRAGRWRAAKRAGSSEQPGYDRRPHPQRCRHDCMSSVPGLQHHAALLIAKRREVLLGLRRIECLAHDHEACTWSRRRRAGPCSSHELRSIGSEENLFGYRRCSHVALDLPPALHLRQDPHRKRFPRKGIESGAVGTCHHVAQAVGKSAGQRLLDHDCGLVQVVGRRDGIGDLLAVFCFVGERGGVHDGAGSVRSEGVRVSVMKPAETAKAQHGWPSHISLDRMWMKPTRHRPRAG